MWRGLSVCTGDVVVYVDSDSEAFGEHFLTDMYSAGHMRTPRKAILDCIESDATISLELDTAMIDGLRSG